MDTYPLTSALHITTLTTGFIQELLLKRAEHDSKYLPQPDVVVFLDASETTIRRFIAQRGRDFDARETYVQRILSVKRAHDEYLTKSLHTLVYMNRDLLDFNKEEDLLKVVDKIKDYSLRQT